MWKFVPLRLVFLIVGLLLAAFITAGQAITFVWLSAFPERASQLESLEIKFWIYAAISVALLIADVVLFVLLVRQFKESLKYSKAAKGVGAKE